MNVASIYCHEIRKNFRKYFGNWEPTESIKLGDIGVIENNMFIHKGNISHFGIKDLEIEKQDEIGNKIFSSKDSVSITFNPNASIEQLNTKAGLKITFSKGDSLFLNAIDCSVERFANKIDLGEKILKIYNSKKKKWQKEWVIVTDLIKSKNTTIAVSESANTSVSFEAKSDLIKEINILDAELSLSIVDNNQVGYCIESKKNIIPFIGVCGIKNKIFQGLSFESMTLKKHPISFRGLGIAQSMDRENFISREINIECEEFDIIHSIRHKDIEEFGQLE